MLKAIKPASLILLLYILLVGYWI